jgi:co-chaperonin GroES (HSP10)
LPKEELKVGSIVIASSLSNVRSDTEENRSDMAIILQVGTGYYDADSGKDVPMDVKPGNVIHLPKMSFRLFTQFPGLQDFTSNTIALAREDEIISKWDSIEAFQSYKATLNS